MTLALIPGAATQARAVLHAWQPEPHAAFSLRRMSSASKTARQELVLRDFSHLPAWRSAAHTVREAHNEAPFCRETAKEGIPCAITGAPDRDRRAGPPATRQARPRPCGWSVDRSCFQPASFTHALKLHVTSARLLHSSRYALARSLPCPVVDPTTAEAFAFMKRARRVAKREPLRVGLPARPQEPTPLVTSRVLLRQIVAVPPLRPSHSPESGPSAASFVIPGRSLSTVLSPRSLSDCLRAPLRYTASSLAISCGLPPWRLHFQSTRLIRGTAGGDRDAARVEDARGIPAAPCGLRIVA